MKADEALLCCSTERHKICQPSEALALETSEQFVDLSVIETE